MDLALLGVDFVIVGRRLRTLEGTTISDGVMASAQGLFDGSSRAIAPLLVWLSDLLSRILFGSPRTAWALANPDELDPELDRSVGAVDVAFDVSIWSPPLGDLPLFDRSSSTQPAGVGGTGPKVESR